MTPGKAKANLEKAMAEYLEEVSEISIKGYSATLTIDGQPVSLETAEVEICHKDKSINFKVRTPFYFYKTGTTGFVTETEPAKMAG